MRTTITRAAIVSLLLGTATVACTDGHVASVSDAAPTRVAAAARHAGKARAALARHAGDAAVAQAERAVAIRPDDADHRLLLGQAYLAAGRFASAEAAFRDTLTLAPDRPRAHFNLALAEIAGGHEAAARGELAALAGAIPDGDLGLAQALAGDADGGIARLMATVRADRSDARTRQNLALAYALAGRWAEARGMAMQDTQPARLERQLSDWGALAGRGQGGSRIAAMFGTVPALADPGVPARLALAPPTAAAPVALALAAPPPAMPAQAPVVAPVRQVALALDAVPPAPAPVAPPPPLIRAPATPARVAVAAAPRGVAPGPELVAVREGGFVVQLGAFARAGAIDAAWGAATRLTPHVVRFTPVRGSTSLSGATLVRLSIGGFRDRVSATALCAALKTRGQACFVRGVGNDAPLQWVRKNSGTAVQFALMPRAPARA